MPDESGVVIDLAYPADVRRARRAVAGLIRTTLSASADDPRVIDILLATSELVSNALEHAGGPCSLRARMLEGGRTIRVEVTDRDADAHVIAAMPSATGSHGRGLAIVETVASRWGTSRSPDDKIVWFEVDVTAT